MSSVSILRDISIVKIISLQEVRFVFSEVHAGQKKERIIKRKLQRINV